MEMDKDIYKAYKESLEIGQCGMLTGQESVKEFCELLFQPQAIVYIVENLYPSLEIVRSLDKRYDLTQYGVYVDKGNITITDKTNISLFGNTKAVVDCTELARHKINVLQGAEAKVNASGYAVVRIECDRLSKAEFTENEHAKVIA